MLCKYFVSFRDMPAVWFGLRAWDILFSFPCFLSIIAHCSLNDDVFLIILYSIILPHLTVSSRTSYQQSGYPYVVTCLTWNTAATRKLFSLSSPILSGCDLCGEKRLKTIKSESSLNKYLIFIKQIKNMISLCYYLLLMRLLSLSALTEFLDIWLNIGQVHSH
jgi:hypothetical protein